MKRPTRTTSVIALGLFASLLMAGCGGTTAPSTTPTTGPSVDQPNVQVSPSATPSATADPDDAPTLAPVGKNVSDVALAYLTERENAASAYRKDPNDWLDDVKDLMTAEGFKALKESVGGGDGDDRMWQTSHEEGLSVSVTVECQADTAAPNTDKDKALLCVTHDQVLGKDGKPLATSKIPASWPYTGTQTATLNMVNTDSGWRVALDASGLAG